MENISVWKPSRFLQSANGKYYPNPEEVSPASFYICNKFIPIYQNAIALFIKGAVLDCGCGKVPYYEMYRDNASSVSCIDWEKSPHDTNHIDIAYDLNQGLPYEAASFDSILLTDVLEHLYAPQVLLNAAANSLRLGGHIVVGVPFFYRIHEAPHDFHRYTEFALEKMLTNAGLKVIRKDIYGGYFDVLFDLLNKRLFKKKFSYRILAALARLTFALPRVKRFNENSKPVFPLGYCIVGQKV